MSGDMKEDISELALCTTCFKIRGHYAEDNGPGIRSYRRREHRCSCQPHDEDWKRSWVEPGVRFDIRAYVDICLLCVRGLMRSGTRWSWLACPQCRRVNNQIGNAVVGEEHPGNRVLALGRHSIMNTRPIPAEGKFPPVGESPGFWLDGWNWREEEGRRLVESGGFTGRATVPLVEWFDAHPPSPGASVDALCRFAGNDLLLELPGLEELKRARHRFLTHPR